MLQVRLQKTSQRCGRMAYPTQQLPQTVNEHKPHSDEMRIAADMCGAAGAARPRGAATAWSARPAPIGFPSLWCHGEVALLLLLGRRHLFKTDAPTLSGHLRPAGLLLEYPDKVIIPLPSLLWDCLSE